jgi:hypothetical protein
MYFRRGVGAASPEQVTAEIRFGCDKFSRVAYFPEQIVLSEVRHEILAVRGNAKSNARNLLHKKRRMRGTIRKMYVKMIDPVSGEEIGKVRGVSGSQRRLEAGSVLAIMPLNQSLWPAFRGSHFLLP